MTSKCSIIERNKIGRLPANWCGKCQKVPETITLPSRKVICADCGAFLSWAKKTKNLGNGRHKRRAFAHELIGPLRCVVCGRSKLGKHEKFHKHHIIPLSRGGADTLENMAITCSTCHDRSHWLRNYAAALGVRSSEWAQVSRRWRTACGEQRQGGGGGPVEMFDRFGG